MTTMPCRPAFRNVGLLTSAAALVLWVLALAAASPAAACKNKSGDGAGCGMKASASADAAADAHASHDGEGAGGGCEMMGAGGHGAAADSDAHAAHDGGGKGKGGGCGMKGGGHSADAAMSHDGQKGRGMGQKMAEGRGMGGMKGGGGMSCMVDGKCVMRTAMSLVHDYRGSIERTIEEIPDGVITTTVSHESADAANAIERHVLEMKGLLDDGGRVRNWDPLFREIFDHRSEIVMKIETVEGGVRVTETSENPDVAALIKAHAYKVSDFVARGPEAVHEATPLPEGYPAASADAKQSAAHDHH